MNSRECAELMHLSIEIDCIKNNLDKNCVRSAAGRCRWGVVTHSLLWRSLRKSHWVRDRTRERARAYRLQFEPLIIPQPTDNTFCMSHPPAATKNSVFSENISQYAYVARVDCSGSISRWDFIHDLIIVVKANKPLIHQKVTKSTQECS